MYENSPDGTDPSNAYAYPSSVKGSDIALFLASIGVDPVDLHTLKSVAIFGDCVEIERVRVMESESGKRGMYRAGEGIARQVTMCRIEWSK